MRCTANHGAHVTPQQHLRRLQTGKTPSYEKTGRVLTADASSSFSSNRKHVEAYEIALQKLGSAPDLITSSGKFSKVVKLTFDLVGAGNSNEMQRGQLVRQEANSVRAVFRLNSEGNAYNLVTMFPQV